MTLASGAAIPTEKIAEICRRYHIVEMAVLGSAARGDMRPESGIDIMVVLEPKARLGGTGRAGPPSISEPRTD